MLPLLPPPAPPPEAPLPPPPDPAPLPPPSMLLSDRCWCWCCSTLEREARSRKGEGGASRGLLASRGFASVRPTKRPRSEVWTGGASDVGDTGELGDMGGEASESAVAGGGWVCEEPEEARRGSGSVMVVRECFGVAVAVGEREWAQKDEGESGKDGTGEAGPAVIGSRGGTVMERAAKGLTSGVACRGRARRRGG